MELARETEVEELCGEGAKLTGRSLADQLQLDQRCLVWLGLVWPRDLNRGGRWSAALGDAAGPRGRGVKAGAGEGQRRRAR